MLIRHTLMEMLMVFTKTTAAIPMNTITTHSSIVLLTKKEYKKNIYNRGGENSHLLLHNTIEK